MSQHSYRDSSGLRTIFSEYRYDALGRRVLTRTRWDKYCALAAPNCLSSVERTAWDGDQILAELSAKDDSTSAAQQTPITYQNDFLGAVRYTHAGGIDEPLRIWKDGVSLNGGVVPHRSWRGLYETGSNLDGTAEATQFTWPARDREIYFAVDSRLTPS